MTTTKLLIKRSAAKRLAKKPQTDSPENIAEGFPTFQQLCEMSDEQLSKIDLGLVNLLCAMGLPYGPDGDIGRYLDWLDDSAEQVRLSIDRSYGVFLENPARFHNSQAFFCIACMVCWLQDHLGVRYHPKWSGITPEMRLPDDFGLSAEDVFIHSIIHGTGGSCCSLPMLYVAIGRRLGYPLKIVKAMHHLYFRWDDLSGAHWVHGDRFNVEASCRGLHRPPDEYYLTWPHPVPQQLLDDGTCGQSYTPRQDIAVCLATRGHVCLVNNYWAGAMEAFGYATRLAPENPIYRTQLAQLKANRQLMRRGHRFLNALDPSIDFGMTDSGPQWLKLTDGREALVQIVHPGRIKPPLVGNAALGLQSLHHQPLIRQHIQTPHGVGAEVDVPLHNSSSPMEAIWLSLGGGRVALAHVPTNRNRFAQQAPHQNQNIPKSGQPILPSEPMPNPAMPSLATMAGPSMGRPTLMSHEKMHLIAQLKQENHYQQNGPQIPGLPEFSQSHLGFQLQQISH